MIKLKFGDEVWFFGTEIGRYAWGDDYTVIHASHTDIVKGVVVDINYDRDSTYVYVNRNRDLIEVSYECLGESMFRTKIDAINNMIKCLEKLRL